MLTLAEEPRLKMTQAVDVVWQVLAGSDHLSGDRFSDHGMQLVRLVVAKDF
jgi:hypothetical protein